MLVLSSLYCLPARESRVSVVRDAFRVVLCVSCAFLMLLRLFSKVNINILSFTPLTFTFPLGVLGSQPRPSFRDGARGERLKASIIIPLYEGFLPTVVNHSSLNPYMRTPTTTSRRGNSRSEHMLK